MWKGANEDPIVGSDKKSIPFYEVMHRRFKEKGPSIADAPEGIVGKRPIAGMRNHFNTLSAGVQNVSVALRMFHACYPTGVNDLNLLSMEIAIHVGEMKKMDYDYKDLEKIKWMPYNAWIVLRDHPKWMDNDIMSECSKLNESALKYLYYSVSNDVSHSTSFQQSPNEVEILRFCG